MDYSLYFHVPFCHRKCPYCHFYVIPNQRRFHDLYMRGLSLEWERVTLPQIPPLSIYFGGGTPALLGPEKIGEILSWINASDNTEITLEMNPEDVTSALIHSFKGVGINRISLGIQSFNDDELQMLGRKHTRKVGIKAVKMIADAGIDNITIDLMYDVPHQEVIHFKESINLAMELPIAHLSLYNLTIEPHTTFYRKKSRLQQVIPDDKSSLEMLNYAISACHERGLERYEISAFGRPSVHNSGYWERRSFLGLGPAAYSFWNDERFANIANLQRYCRALHHHESAINFREKLSSYEQRKEQLAVGLRLIKGVDRQLVLSNLWGALDEWIIDDGERVRLNERGLLFHDTVAEMIMAAQ